MKYILAVIAFLILLPLAASQIILPLAETQFTIGPIVLAPIPPSPGSSGPGGNVIGPSLPFADFTGTTQILVLRGDLDYLRVGWNAAYVDNAERNIGARCYLNCPNPGNDIDANCAAFQKCEYVGLVGPRSCLISNPKYELKLPPMETNTVTCKFYDPLNPSVPFKPYPKRTFRPIDYSLSVSPITATVGDQFSFPLSVVSVGLLASAYTFSVTELSEPNSLTIDRTIGNTENLDYGVAGRFTPKMISLFAKVTNLEILANANSDPVACSIDADCSYLGDGKCVVSQGTGRCWKKLDIQLKAGNASLPDFDIFGFLQIMVLSTVVLILVRRK